MTYKQLLNRLFWTVAQSLVGGLSAPVIFDFAMWKGLATAGLASAATVLSLFIRQKLAESEAPIAP